MRKAAATTKIAPDSAAEAKAKRAEAGKGSLVVVSNRLPFTAVHSEGEVRFKRSPGGLVAALDPALSRRGGVWIGWPGVETEEAASTVEMLAPSPRSSRVRYRSVALSRREVNLYYGGFSNRTLWPLFHYFVGRVEMNATTWAMYELVNERFAQAAAEEGSEDALVWVHDYQLLRMPRYLRRLAPRRRIAFFLHIPFPAYDIFRLLPWARSIMRGMLSCDLVGFQSAEHAEHFINCADRLLGCAVDRASGTVQFEGHPVAAQSHPIGIDVGHIEKLAARVKPQPRESEPIEILGLDRLDYTKGIPERLNAVETFFERYPAYRGKIVFLQLAVPTRTGVAEYQALKRVVDEMVGRINGRFSDRGWSPIRYLVRSVGEEELVTMYRNAEVALVTPLRDGMNLVAKEYVASRLDNDGVLILSELAGASEELKEAILVNPYDVDEVVEALRRALSIPEDERRARMLALRHRVQAGDVQHWVRQFLRSAEAAAKRRERAEVEIQSPTDFVRGRLHQWLAQRPTLALFFDYDGTLTPVTERPEDAVLSPAARRLLHRATRTPNLDVAIVSARPIDELRHLVGLPGITYLGNHGFEIEGPGISYRHSALAKFDKQVEAAATELSKIDVAGVRLARKGSTLAVHTRSVKLAERSRVESRASAILRRHRLRVTQRQFVVEGRPPVDWNKGFAVLTVLARRHGVDWSARVRALYVGDDVTDEDAFRSLKGIGRSIRVGESTHTVADYGLPDSDAVIDLLRWLASGAFESDER